MKIEQSFALKMSILVIRNCRNWRKFRPQINSTNTRELIQVLLRITKNKLLKLGSIVKNILIINKEVNIENIDSNCHLPVQVF